MISPRTIGEKIGVNLSEEEAENYKEFISNKDDDFRQSNLIAENKLRKIAYEIHKEVVKTCNDCLREEIWVDIPFSPKFDESERTYITPFTKDDIPDKLSVYFPAKRWGKQYAIYKYKAHIFCTPEYVNEVAKASKKILSDKYNIYLNRQAFELCNINPPQ